MKRVASKTLKWLSFLAILIVVMMMIAAIGMSSAVYWAHKSGRLQQWISDQLGVKTRFTLAGVEWKGIHPALSLKQLKLYTKKQPLKPSFKLAKLDITFDLIRSLTQMRLATSQIALTGAKLRLVEDQSGHLKLEGASVAKGGSVNWAQFWQWLSPQQSIVLKRSLLIIMRPQQRPLALRNFGLSWKRVSIKHYHFSAQSLLPKRAQGVVHIEANITGQNPLEKGSQAQIYASIRAKHIMPLLQGRQWQHLRLQNGGGLVRLWLHYQDQHWQSAQLVAQLKKLMIENTLQHQLIHLGSIQHQLQWKRLNNQGWQVQILPWQAHNQPNIDMQIALHHQPFGQQHRWVINATHLDIGYLSHLLTVLPGVPKWLRHDLFVMSPSGQLLDTHFTWVTQPQKPSHYIIDTQLSQLALKADPQQRWPGISGLQGHVHATDQWGRLTLDSPALQLNQPKWFQKPLPAIKTQAEVVWQQHDQHWSIQAKQIQLHNANLDVHLMGGLQWQVGKIPQLALMGHYQLNNINQSLSRYLPQPPLMEKGLRDWLIHDVLSVPVARGGLVFRGPLNAMPFLQHQGVMQAEIVAQNARFRPHTGWPAFDGVAGRVLFNNQRFEASAEKGHYQDAKIVSAHLLIPDMTPHMPSDFTITGKVTTSGKTAHDYISKSPLDKTLSGVMQWVKVSGPLGLDLHLRFPLGKPKVRDEVGGTVTLKGNQIQLHGSTFGLSQATGAVSFNGFNIQTKAVKGQLFGQKATIAVATNMNMATQQWHSTQIHVNGRLDVAHLAKQFPSPAWHYVQGSTPFNASITVAPQQTTAVIQSPMTGVASMWPSPLYKAANMPAPLRLKIHYQPQKGVFIYGQLGSILSEAMQLRYDAKHNLSLAHAGVALGAGKKATLPTSPGVTLTGNIPYLSLQDWQSKLSTALDKVKFTSSMDQGAFAGFLHDLNVNVGQLVVGDQTFDQVSAKLAWQNQAWRIAVTAPKVMGVISLPQNWDKPQYSARLSYLYLSQHEKEKGQLSGVSVLSLAKWPAFDLNIQQLYINDKDYGTIELSSQPIPNGVKVQQFSMTNANVALSVSGNAIRQAKQNHFVLKGHLSGKNWGKFLDLLGYKNVLANGAGTIDFNGSWQGALLAPDVATLQGQVNVKLQDGTLLDINPGMGRYLGLFSLSSLTRRLSLNFSDVTDKGLAFNSLQGRYTIANGIARTKSFQMDGPAMNLNMSGEVNLVKRTLDQRIVVVPQVGGGLALAVGLVGGPIAGIATWLADKVLTSTILRDKGLVYRVYGPWHKPQVVNLLEKDADKGAAQKS